MANSGGRHGLAVKTLGSLPFFSRYCNHKYVLIPVRFTHFSSSVDRENSQSKKEKVSRMLNSSAVVTVISVAIVGHNAE